MVRKRDYIYLRPDSRNWRCRLQLPPTLAKALGTPAVKDFSLRVPDRRAAEIAAMPHIHAHLTLLEQARTVQWPNQMQANRPASQPSKEPIRVTGIVVDAKPRLPSANLSIVQTWLTHRGIDRRVEREALEVLADWNRLTDGKPFRKADRDDARKLAEHYRQIGNKSQTIRKKVGHLSAACELAIEERKLTYNPFRKVVPKVKDKLTRLPLDDYDMKLVAKNLSKLRLEDQLLWKLLATTGMRLDEAFQIKEEFLELGKTRYVIVGTKTAESLRRVPLPSALLKDLPKRIEGRLFHEGSETVAKRLRYFLKGLGISYDAAKGTGDRRKVIHGLRHRAKDQLRALRCPQDVQFELLGHEKKTVAAGYGWGSPMTELLHWIDQIGW